METITQIILGEGVTWVMFFAFFTMGVLGLVSSVMFDVYSSGIDTHEFKLFKFLGDNRIRLMLSILAIIIGVLFSEQILGASLNTWTAFLSGFTSDKIIENMMQRRRKKIDKQGITPKDH